MALLLSVYMQEGPHTVRGLAKALRISKPAVSRALDRLGELGYIRRERDDLDRRNVLVRRTTNGGGFLKAFAAMIVDAQAVVGAVPDHDLDFGIDTTAVTSEPAVEQAWVDVAA